MSAHVFRHGANIRCKARICTASQRIPGFLCYLNRKTGRPENVKLGAISWVQSRHAVETRMVRRCYSCGVGISITEIKLPKDLHVGLERWDGHSRLADKMGRIASRLARKIRNPHFRPLVHFFCNHTITPAIVFCLLTPRLSSAYPD
jgi:hypothetical protein